MKGDIWIKSNLQVVADFFGHGARIADQFFVWNDQAWDFSALYSTGQMRHGPPVFDHIVNRKLPRAHSLLESNLGRHDGARVPHGDEKFGRRKAGENLRNVISIGRS